jgi:hypothetical protein
LSNPLPEVAAGSRCLIPKAYGKFDRPSDIENRSNSAADFSLFDPLFPLESAFRQKVWQSDFIVGRPQD